MPAGVSAAGENSVFLCDDLGTGKPSQAKLCKREDGARLLRARARTLHSIWSHVRSAAYGLQPGDQGGSGNGRRLPPGAFRRFITTLRTR